MDDQTLAQIKAGLDRFREGGKYVVDVREETDEHGKNSLRATRTNTLTGEKSDFDPGNAPLQPPK